MAPLGTNSVPSLSPDPRVMGGVKTGPKRYCWTMRRASASSSGVRSMISSSSNPCRSNGGGLVGNGWVGERVSPGTSLAGTGRSSMGQTGSPVTRSKT